LKLQYLNLFLIPLLIAGCKSAPPLFLSPNAENTKVGKSDPDNNFDMIGPVTVYDGEGCGGFGYRGTYERAVTDLRNRVYYMGGDYAQIISITEPHLRGGCFDNVYSITANVYKKTRELEAVKVKVEVREESFANKLRELKKLFDEGVLSKDEYEKQKTALLQKGI
jgi:Short C-terminal domain